MRIQLVLGLIALAAAGAAQEPVEIPLPNGGFEKGFEGWANATPDRFGAFVSIDREVKRSGEASVRFSCEEPGKAPWLARSVPVQGGATYVLKAWCRGVAGGRSMGAVKIEFYNDQGVNTSGHYSEMKTPGEEWQEVSVEATAGPDSTRAALLVRQYQGGQLWFDDVAFLRVGEAPALTINPPRTALVAGTTRLLELIVQLRDPRAGEAPKVQVALVRSDGRPIPTPAPEVVAKGARAFQVSARLPRLAPGDYALRVSLPEGTAACGIFVTPAQRKPRNLTADGVILANGKPFFPIGLYHVSPSEYALLAAHGFNCAQGSNTRDHDRFGESLELAQKAGIMIDVPFYADHQVAQNLPLSRERIRRFRNHPAVLNWKIIDEPDLQPKIRDEVPEVYRQLRAADPDHPLLLTIASPPSYGYWAHFCDILQIDPYPLPTQPLTMVSDYCDQARAVLEPWQNLTAVLQCGWITGPPMNQPTFEQARVMVYLAVIHGAKGIFWYSMHDPGWNLTKTPLWARFKELNAETAQLGGIVLGGKPVAVSASNKEVHAAAWEHDGRLHILITNPGKEARVATLRLDRGITEARLLRGEGKPEVRDGALVVDLPALGSGVVEAK